MKWDAQGVDRGPYTVVPRTLVFIVHQGYLLLLRGAPSKRLWAGKLNGIGGHIEPGEDPLAAARRELWEEAGLEVEALALRALIHVSPPGATSGVMLFVYLGQSPSKRVCASAEGALRWYPLEALPLAEMVDDLPLLLPRVLGEIGQGHLVYGNYVPDRAGELTFHFSE